jgi:hypothetical protein
MSYRTAAWLAWSLWALCVVLAAFAMLLASYTLPGPIRDDSYWAVVIAVSLLSYPTVGAFVASRRPENLIGWILCGVGFLFVTEGFALAYSDFALSVDSGSLPAERIALWVSGWFDFPMVLVGLVLTILLFPNGRLPAPNWRAVPWVAASGGLLWTLWWATRSGHPVINWFFGLGAGRNPFAVKGFLGDFFDMLGRLGAVALLVMCVASVIGVFMRLGDSQGEERQQIKWFAYGAAFLVGAPFLIAPAVGGIIEAMGGSWEVGLASPILAGLLGLPIALGVAILKYRLYDIDIIINRTLVYGSLTGILALVYLGGVTAAQTLFRTITTQQELPQLVVVASTLVIAALFNPLRRRIQSFIDRSFYRRKYDAAKTLEGFSMKLRDETDLEALNDELIGVVRQTMQPAHVSLWFREPWQVRDSSRGNRRVVATRRAGDTNKGGE